MLGLASVPSARGVTASTQVTKKLVRREGGGEEETSSQHLSSNNTVYLITQGALQRTVLTDIMSGLVRLKGSLLNHP